MVGPTTASRIDQISSILAEVYAAGRVIDESGQDRPVYPNGVDAEQGAQLAELVTRERAKRTFEVGFATGLSSLHICLGLLRTGNDAARHIAIDPTESTYWRNAGRRLVERAELSDMIELIERESQLVLPQLVNEGSEFSFDLAFIDGDHRFDPAFLDLFYSIRLVRPGGLVVVDDMWMAPVRLAVAFFETNLGLELLPDAIPGAFRWGRRRKDGVRSGTGGTAVLRRPPFGDRPWDHFTRFF